MKRREEQEALENETWRKRKVFKIENETAGLETEASKCNRQMDSRDNKARCAPIT